MLSDGLGEHIAHDNETGKARLPLSNSLPQAGERTKVSLRESQINRVTDQAEGLRRLQVRASARVITVAAARTGLGATSLVVNLATALAQDGKDVLVLDENLSHDNVANMLALKPRHDLLNAVRGDKPWREIMLHTRQGVRVLPVARAIHVLPQLSPPERGRLLECLAEASRGADVVLVDAAATEERHISASLAPDQPLLLVLNATASAITESYALIKRMVMQDGRQSFEIVVNKARDGQEAQVVFGNVAQVARRHLHVRVEYLGYIPVDEKLNRATQLCRPVVEAFPAAPAARAIGELGRNLMLLPAAGNEGAGSLSDVVQRLMRQARSPIMAHAN
jgi:flagellar biosynthesis protein FlhG